MKHPETSLQISIIELLSWKYPDISKCCYAVNHGIKYSDNAKVNIIRAMFQKKIGVRRGISDLFILKKTKQGQSVVWIELKAGKNKQSGEQNNFEQLSKDAGCLYYICRSIDEFCKIIEDNYR